MAIIQKIFLTTVPLSTVLTTAAMLMPCWWSSETLIVGLWRARAGSSTWLLVEPQLQTSEGRILFTLQILSFASGLLADISGILWLLIFLRSPSLKCHVSLLIFTILTYLCLSTMIYLVWQTTQDYTHLVRISYSFYLVLLVIILHSLTLISLAMNLRKSHSIQPIATNEKVRLAFDESIVAV